MEPNYLGALPKRCNKRRERALLLCSQRSPIFSIVQAKRMITDLGTSLPPLYETLIIDDYIHVNDLDCIVGCRQWMEREVTGALL